MRESQGAGSLTQARPASRSQSPRGSKKLIEENLKACGSKKLMQVDGRLSLKTIKIVQSKKNQKNSQAKRRTLSGNSIKEIFKISKKLFSKRITFIF